MRNLRVYSSTSSAHLATRWVAAWFAACLCITPPLEGLHESFMAFETVFVVCGVLYIGYSGNCKFREQSRFSAPSASRTCSSACLGDDGRSQKTTTCLGTETRVKKASQDNTNAATHPVPRSASTARSAQQRVSAQHRSLCYSVTTDVARVEALAENGAREHLEREAENSRHTPCVHEAGTRLTWEQRRRSRRQRTPQP